MRYKRLWQKWKCEFVLQTCPMFGTHNEWPVQGSVFAQGCNDWHMLLRVGKRNCAEEAPGNSNADCRHGGKGWERAVMMGKIPDFTYQNQVLNICLLCEGCIRLNTGGCGNWLKSRYVLWVLGKCSHPVLTWNKGPYYCFHWPNNVIIPRAWKILHKLYKHRNAH